LESTASDENNLKNVNDRNMPTALNPLNFESFIMTVPCQNIQRQSGKVTSPRTRSSILNHGCGCNALPRITPQHLPKKIRKQRLFLGQDFKTLLPIRRSNCKPESLNKQFFNRGHLRSWLSILKHNRSAIFIKEILSCVPTKSTMVQAASPEVGSSAM
jgi:hypothetical protein